MESRFQGEGVVPGEYFFGFYKTRHILLSDSANCTVLRAVVLTQYRRVTDRQTDRKTDGRTDGIAVASTALAMRTSWRAVKIVLRRLSVWSIVQRGRCVIQITTVHYGKENRNFNEYHSLEIFGAFVQKTGYCDWYIRTRGTVE